MRFHIVCGFATAKLLRQKTSESFPKARSEETGWL